MLFKWQIKTKILFKKNLKKLLKVDYAQLSSYKYDLSYWKFSDSKNYALHFPNQENLCYKSPSPNHTPTPDNKLI